MPLMEILSFQQKFINDQLLKDYALLGELEDSLRTEDDPKRKTKIRGDIAEIKEQIAARTAELEDLQNRDSNHSQVPQQLGAVPEPPLSLTTLPETSSPTSRKEIGNRQIDEAVEALRKSIKQEASEDDADQIELLDDFHLLRLQLVTCAKLASTISSSMLGRHEVNRLYLRRERLVPTPSELNSLLRLLINDHLGYVPGWYWFKDFEAARVESVILHLAFSDPENSVRQGAFELLAAAEVPLPDHEKENISWTVTSDSSADVRNSALSYLGRVGGQEYLPIVHSALADREKGVLYQAKVSKYLILARTEGERALSELLEEPNLNSQDLENILIELSKRKGEISTSTLLKTLPHSQSGIRLFGVEELIARSELSIEDAVKLKADADESIQAAVFHFLIERDEEIEPYELSYKLPDSNLRFGRNSIFKSLSKSDKWNEIVLMLYQEYDFSRLPELSDWNEPASPGAYRTLAIKHFEKFAERLRSDLRTDFASDSEKYYQKQLEEYRELFEKPVTNLLSSNLFGFRLGTGSSQKKREPEESAKSSVEWYKKYFQTAALEGLLENGSPADIEFGRQFLFHADEDVRIGALKILRKWGSENDIPNLIKIAQSTDGLVQELAAQAALAISGNSLEVARELLKIGDEVVISITLSELILSSDKKVASDFLKKYLYSDDENIRTRAMTFFALKLDSKELTDLLNEYMSEAVYYYDVVCCFDRILYSPATIRSYYNQIIKSIFFGLLDD